MSSSFNQQPNTIPLTREKGFRRNKGVGRIARRGKEENPEKLNNAHPVVAESLYNNANTHRQHNPNGGARKYRSKKANKNKRSKTGKTKKRKC